MLLVSFEDISILTVFSFTKNEDRYQLVMEIFEVRLGPSHPKKFTVVKLQLP